MYFPISLVTIRLPINHVTFAMSCYPRDWCGPIVSALVKSRYIAFSEGWALYAESPLIAMETGKTLSYFLFYLPLRSR